MASLPAEATDVSIGSLSFDTFIPGSSGSPGVDAFNIANLTGIFGLPPDFPVADSLTFQGATLILNPIGQSTEVFVLGDIAPGFLLDSGGNPVVQVPSNQVFASAEFQATLSAFAFTLADGTHFSAASGDIDLLLLPSVGNNLTADIDQITIGVAAAAASVPEPATWPTSLFTLAFFWRRFWRSR